MNTNDATRANADPMPEMSRRSFLRAAPVLGLAASAPAIAPKDEAMACPFEPIEWPADRADMWAMPLPTPKQRLDAAIGELKAAAKAVWPDISSWSVSIDEGSRFPLMIAAKTPRRASALVSILNGETRP